MLPAGTTIAGYRVERLLGNGGMGTVYLATQRSLKRPVALKLLSPMLSADETFRARFRREGEVQAALDHPHIVPIYEAGTTDDDQLYLAMRYVRGSTLKELAATGDLDPARTLRLLAPVASALDAAHASGLIHRDVKPHNVLVDQTDWPYLADFGLTRGGGAAASGPTRTGQIVGTFAYVAPEQVQGLPASPRSDQYALAAVLFECLSGRAPHEGESDAALLYAKVHTPPPLLSAQASADLPAGFDAVLARGLAVDPAERFPNTTALLEAAAEALERPAPAAVPVPVPDPGPEAPGPEPEPEPERPAAGQETALLDAGDLPSVVTRRPPTPRAEPGPAPAPPRPPRRERAGERAPIGPLVAAGLAALVVAGGLGLLLAPSEEADPPPPGPPVRTAAVALTGPPGWVAARAVPEIAGLELERARALAPRRGAPAGMVVGMADAGGAGLLPGALRRALGTVPEGEPVRMGELQALRYAVPAKGGSRPYTLFAAPTSVGVAMTVCLGGEAAQAPCRGAAATAEAAAGAEALPLAARPEYAAALSEALERLGRERAAGRKAFTAAKRRATQATAAGELATAYAAAARRVRRLPDGPREAPAQREVARALDAVAAAMRDLRDAARGGDARAYAAARTRARAREAAVARAIRGLEPLGYDVA